MRFLALLALLLSLTLQAAAQMPPSVEKRIKELGFQSDYWDTYIRMARLHRREAEIEGIITSRLSFLHRLKESCSSFQAQDISHYLYYSDLGLSADSLAGILNAKEASDELLKALNGFLSVAAGYLQATPEELEVLAEAFALRNYSRRDLTVLTGLIKTLHGRDFGMKSESRKKRLISLFREGYSISFIKRQLEDLS